MFTAQKPYDHMRSLRQIGTSTHVYNSIQSLITEYIDVHNIFCWRTSENKHFFEVQGQG